MAIRRSEGIPRPIDEKVIRISNNLKELLESERRKEGERYTTIMERMIYERAQTIKNLRQENDSLKSLIQSMGREV
jgi:septal ring factor EnvC (AmiA/AmiB activator)